MSKTKQVPNPRRKALFMRLDTPVYDKLTEIAAREKRARGTQAEIIISKSIMPQELPQEG